jgi:hypothetical protein
MTIVRQGAAARGCRAVSVRKLSSLAALPVAVRIGNRGSPGTAALVSVAGIWADQSWLAANCSSRPRSGVPGW